MKTLKLFRLLSMAAGLLCFLISCLPQGEAGYDWAMIVVLVFFLVIGPASLIRRKLMIPKTETILKNILASRRQDLMNTQKR